LILFTIAPYFNEISIVSDWMEYFLFFATGDILSKYFLNGNVHNIAKAKWIIPVAVIFLLSQTYYVYNLVTRIEFLSISLLGCLFMIQISILLEKHFALEWLRIIGLHSLQIYLMHVIFAGLSRTIFMKLLNIHEPHLLLFLGIIFSTILPIVTYNSRIFQQNLWFLFSPRKPTNTVPAKNT
jgi:peptidoglycan/LPS O-acetylase OafA/YrhL